MKKKYQKMTKVKKTLLQTLRANFETLQIKIERINFRLLFKDYDNSK